MLSEGLKNVEELERLEALEQLNRDIAAMLNVVVAREPALESAGVIEESAPSTEVVTSSFAVSSGKNSLLNEGSPIISPRNHFPQSRLASEEISLFDAFAAKILPFPGLLDPDVLS